MSYSVFILSFGFFHFTIYMEYILPPLLSPSFLKSTMVSKCVNPFFSKTRMLPILVGRAIAMMFSTPMFGMAQSMIVFTAADMMPFPWCEGAR